jgi:hypothetical protein
MNRGKGRMLIHMLSDPPRTRDQTICSIRQVGPLIVDRAGIARSAPPRLSTHFFGETGGDNVSRLTEIIENHQNLDQLFAILKHYGVSAEFVSATLLNEFRELQASQDEAKESEAAEDADLAPLIEDLTQFDARF